MKKIKTTLVACVAALSFGGLTACSPKEVHVESVSVASASVTLSIGEQVTLAVTVSPEKATEKGVTFASSDESIVTVSADGKLTAVAVGNATITVTSVDGSKTATVDVKVEYGELSVTLPIRQSVAYQTYLTNIKPNEVNKFAEFTDRTQKFEVGNDNKVSFRPDLTITNENDRPIVPEAWTEPFTISVFKKNGNEYVAAPSSEYEVVDAVKCDVKFADSVTGEYKVRVVLGGLTEAEKAALGDLTPITAEYEVKVVDGYNVTDPVELAYLDTTVKNETRCDWGHGNDAFTPDLPAFKAAHGLTAAQPKALIFQNDMHISKASLPEEYFIRESDMTNWDAAEKKRSEGSLKDWVYFYNKVDEEKIAISGNYFTLDWSEIPLITRPWGEVVDGVDEKVESHGGFFRSYGGEIEIKNINFIGNAHAAKTDDDVKLAGGMIGFKTQGTTSAVTVNNVLGHGCYITFFNNIGETSSPDLRVSKAKLYDNYHTFFYNWGASVYAEDSIFEGCGGPVLMQDHTGDENGVYDHLNFYKVGATGLEVQAAPDGDTVAYSFDVVGHAPEATFVDCEFNNYLIGTEAWFQSFGAAGVSGQIKKLGDFLAGYSGGARSMIFDKDHNPSTYAALAAAGQDSMFNFIVLNKSGSAEGMTAAQVDGSVRFLHRQGELLVPVDEFNYLAPANTNGVPVLGNTEEGLAGVLSAVEQYKFRSAGLAGAPIFETAGGVAFWPGEGEQLLEVSALPSYVPLNPAESTFMSGAHEYTTIYFNGMGLVFALNKVAA